MGEASERYFFAPQTQYANVGDTVTWTNGTDVAHTVTSDSGSELASDSVGDGATFDHTFTAEGTFAYHCTIHPYMTGKIVVLAAGAALPRPGMLPALDREVLELPEHAGSHSTCSSAVERCRRLKKKAPLRN